MVAVFLELANNLGVDDEDDPLPESRMDPDYFDETRSWSERLSSLLQRRTFRSAFRAANAQVVPRILAADRPGLRAVINMGAASLCSFLEQGKYLNAYERPRVEGVQIAPSESRQTVDRLLFGDEMEKYYFAAISLGGLGCRFYGEFCVALRPERIQESSVFDRNSYDLLSPPLDAPAGRPSAVRALRGVWSRDVVPMLTAKIMPELPEENRLTTPGQISDLVLRDEDFAEVHIRDAITPEHVEEVRKSPEESTVAIDILERYRAGDAPSSAELVWGSWRHRTDELLRKHGIKTRLVSTRGRGYRWG